MRTLSLMKLAVLLLGAVTAEDVKFEVQQHNSGVDIHPGEVCGGLANQQQQQQQLLRCCAAAEQSIVSRAEQAMLSETPDEDAPPGDAKFLPVLHKCRKAKAELAVGPCMAYYSDSILALERRWCTRAHFTAERYLDVLGLLPEPPPAPQAKVEVRAV
jgi:hypothetical protein